MLKRILKWLAGKIIPESIKIRVSKLKQLVVIDGEAKLEEISEDETKGSNPINSSPISPAETRDAAKEFRLAQLRHSDDYEAAVKAQETQYGFHDIENNPEVIGADTKYEAQLKMAIARGEDITDQVEENPRVTEDEVQEMLGTQWCARWGYNQYGDDLAAKINQPETFDDPTSPEDTEEDEGTDRQTSSNTNSSSGSSFDHTSAAKESRSKSQSSTESNSGDTDSQTATRVNIDTDSGSVTPSPSPNSGGGANKDGGPNG